MHLYMFNFCLLLYKSGFCLQNVNELPLPLLLLCVKTAEWIKLVLARKLFLAYPALYSKIKVKRAILLRRVLISLP